MENFLSTNETINVVSEWIMVLDKLIDITDSELGALLKGVNGAEIIGERLGGIRCDKVSMFKLVFMKEYCRYAHPRAISLWTHDQ